MSLPKVPSSNSREICIQEQMLLNEEKYIEEKNVMFVFLVNYLILVSWFYIINYLDVK